MVKNRLNPSSPVFVAGHRGMVGSAIVRHLHAEGFDNILTRTRQEVNLTNQQETQTFFRSQAIDTVILAAAKVGGIHANATFPAEFIYENLMIQSNVIHAAYLTGVRHLLFLGSSCIYPKHAPQPLKEEYLLTGPLESTNEPYAIAKIAGIKLCQYYNRQYKTSFYAVMPTNLYGQNDNYDLEQSHVLPALIRKFHLAKLAEKENWDAVEKDEALYGPIPADIKNALGMTSSPIRKGRPAVLLWGTGTPRREFLHVNDLAEACVFLLKNDAIPGNPDFPESEAFLPPLINIGCQEDIAIRELALMIREITGFQGEVAWDPTKPDGTPRKLLDISKISAMGWKPRIPLKEGIRQTYQYYLNKS
jgi:GDP-L-fucose synthase